MNDPSLATSADYADAMLVARRAKNWLFLILLLMLLVQIGLFFVARFTDIIVPASLATTRPAFNEKLLYYLTGLTTFFGTILPMLLALVLLLLVHIMLVGRLIGVGRVTSAFVWCLLLILLLFPWQAFLGNSSFDSRDFPLPGVLYTWEELAMHAKFGITQPISGEFAILKWARFVGWPVVAVVLLLSIQVKSNRGLRQALGETMPDINITT